MFWGTAVQGCHQFWVGLYVLEDQLILQKQKWRKMNEKCKCSDRSKRVKSDYNLLVGFLGFEWNFTIKSFLQWILKYTEYFHLRLTSDACFSWLMNGPKQNFGWDILICPSVGFVSTSVHYLGKLVLPAMFYCYLISHFGSLVCKPIDNTWHVSFITVNLPTTMSWPHRY